MQSDPRDAARARKLLDQIAKRGYGSSVEMQTLETAVSSMRYGPETIHAIVEATAAKQPYVLYTPQVSPIRGSPATCFPSPRPWARNWPARCRGEYEPLSVAVYALEDLNGRAVSVSDLIAGWHDPGRRRGHPRGEVLVPGGPGNLGHEAQDLRARATRQGRSTGAWTRTRDNYLRSTSADAPKPTCFAAARRAATSRTCGPWMPPPCSRSMCRPDRSSSSGSRCTFRPMPRRAPTKAW